MFLFGVLLLLIGLAVFIFLFKDKLQFRPKYRPRGALFTPAESVFLHVLDKSIGDQYRVFGKVRLGDVVEAVPGVFKSSYIKARNQVFGKHLDYILCCRETNSIVCAIELDDSSHNRQDRVKRDHIVNMALKSAKIPLVRIKCSNRYDAAIVRNKIIETING